MHIHQAARPTGDFIPNCVLRRPPWHHGRDEGMSEWMPELLLWVKQHDFISEPRGEFSARSLWSLCGVLVVVPVTIVHRVESAFDNLNQELMLTTSPLVILVPLSTITALYEVIIHLAPLALMREATLEHASVLTPQYPLFTQRGVKDQVRPHFLWQSASSQPERKNL